MTRLAKFFRRSGVQRRLFFAALWWLWICRLATLFLPFRWIAPHLGRHMAQTLDTVEIKSAGLLEDVRWAVEAAARYAPWRCLCLEQAMAAMAVLHGRGIESTLYLGMARDESGDLRAHAWLRCGRVIVTGRRGQERYTVVATFAGGQGSTRHG